MFENEIFSNLVSVINPKLGRFCLLKIGITGTFLIFLKNGVLRSPRGVNPQKNWYSSCSKLPQYGHLKLVPQGAWYHAKEISSIQLSCAEKMSKMSLNIDIFSLTDILSNISLKCFLRTGCLDWTKSFCIASGSLRHKFRIPTWGILEQLDNQLI